MLRVGIRASAREEGHGFEYLRRYPRGSDGVFVSVPSLAAPLKVFTGPARRGASLACARSCRQTTTNAPRGPRRPRLSRRRRLAGNAARPESAGTPAACPRPGLERRCKQTTNGTNDTALFFPFFLLSLTISLPPTLSPSRSRPRCLGCGGAERGAERLVAATAAWWPRWDRYRLGDLPRAEARH